MKEYQSKDIRNVAIAGHGGCGKTMATESMLVCGGMLNRLGHIMQKNTASDFHEDEQDRQISIYTALFTLEWQEKKLNLLDIPGYADFIGEALGALYASDLLALVINVAHGIEVGSEKMWDYATSFHIPKMIIVSGLDKENTTIDKTIAHIKEHFGKMVIPFTFPVNSGPGFNKLIDIIHQKEATYNLDESGTYEAASLNGTSQEKANQWHNEIAECIAESNDTLLEKFFEQGKLSEEELDKGINEALCNNSLIPLFCVSGETNVGFRHVLDFVANYGPSPLERKTITGKNNKNEEIAIDLNTPEPLSFVFKTISEAGAGELSFCKVFSGDIKGGATLYNSSKDISERIGQLFAINGKNRDQVDTLHRGDIGAIAKLKNTHTNQTLCSTQHIISIMPLEYPKPNIHIAVKPKSKGDEEKMSLGLSSIHQEDPTFICKMDAELHQVLIGGQGELHIEVCVNRLRKKFHLELDMYKPKIPYRETVKAHGDAKYRHKKQSGGAGQFAEVWMRLDPIDKNQDVEFMNSLVGQNVDRVYVPSVEKGVKTACERGVKVDFYDGKQHPVDSKDIAFQIAGRHAFREAFLNARPCLLEPIMNVAIKVPEEFMGDVMSHISSRRGKILGMDCEGLFQIIKAQVPQSEMYRYATTLRSLTGGRGIHTEEFSHYEEMPHELETKVVETSKKEHEAENTHF